MRATITPIYSLVHFFVAAAFVMNAIPAAAVSVAIIPFPGGLANENGTGLFPELVDALYASEVDSHVRLYPAKRAFRMYDNNYVQVLVSVPICRWKDSHFLTLGLTDFELFLGRTDQTLPRPGDKLVGKTIAVVAGYTHSLRTREPDWKWRETRDYEHAIQMLVHGRVDYVYGYAFLIHASVARLKMAEAVHYDPTRIFDQTIPAIAFHSDAAGLAEAKKLQLRMKDLIADGRYQRMMQYYGYPNWYYSDGLAGKITITQQWECQATQ